ncbi:MAG: anaerobic ribonucleoside-triphosphate reductase activating protein [Oscillospiraceae bacterium]|nr:anaerobic ribonucleoside-triphosphate reductase activating protein [Oscillospiraceae bacterium]
MKIAGFQKLTLLDFPGKTACTVFTWGCNLRCPFCHNAGLVTEPLTDSVTTDELYAFLRKRAGLLDGVCVTGGEPLLQPDLPDFLLPIRDMGYAVKLDTNGTNPEKLREICESGLIDMVAMDIKNCPEKYAATAGTERISIDAVHRSVRYLMQQGKIPYEFRTTVVRQYHTAEDFAAIGKWIRGADAYFLQNFRNTGQLIDNSVSGFTPSEMRQFLEIVRKDVPNAALRGI